MYSAATRMNLVTAPPARGAIRSNGIYGPNATDCTAPRRSVADEGHPPAAIRGAPPGSGGGHPPWRRHYRTQGPDVRSGKADWHTATEQEFSLTRRP